MTRRHHPLLLLALLVVSVVGACGSQAAPTLTDPKEILTKTVDSLKDVKTVHLRADISGQLSFDPSALMGGSAAPGGSSSQTSVDLKGTSAQGDLDVAGSKAHLNLSAPAFLNLTADVIAVDGDIYTKVSLLGPKYQKTAGTSALPVPLPSASLSPQGVTDTLTQALDKLSTPPKFVGVDQVDGKDAYHVSLTVSQKDVGAALPSPLTTTSAISLDVWSYVDGLRPAKVELKGGDASTGTLDVILTLTNYDQAVTIQAPPADQVQTSTTG